MLGEEAKGTVLFFDKVQRSDWTICAECPIDEIYSASKKLKTQSAVLSLASILLIILCMVFLYKKMMKAVISKESMEADTKVAEKMQRSLLPKKNSVSPERKDMDIHGLLLPAKMVGGDLYSYIVRDDKLFFCIGDISGKGIPAALFMSIIVSHFHDKSKSMDSASEIVASLNDILSSDNDENMFCTMFLGVLNLTDGRLDYCNAGHDAPVVLRKKEGGYDAESLSSGHNLVIGAFDGAPFSEEHTDLQPGDNLFMFTDGISEAENKNKELFGTKATFDGILKVFNSNTGSSVAQKVDLMLAEVRNHTKGAVQNDDITMLLIEYKGPIIG